MNFATCFPSTVIRDSLVAGIPVLDAVNILARHMINEADPEKLEPLIEGTHGWGTRPSSPCRITMSVA